jgi:neutral ceramidase
MKFLRILGKSLAILLFVVAGLAIATLTTVDESPLRKSGFYKFTRQHLTELPPPLPPVRGLRAGWAKQNLTPAYTTPTAGYGVRHGQHWTSVHDSVFVRAIALDNGSTRAALVALDLLITPPTVVDVLKKRLPEVGLRWENVYLGTTHSHNSLGGWAPGLLGQQLSGDYDERVVTHIADTILRAIAAAQRNMAPVQIGYGQADGQSLVYNRLIDNGPIDGTIQLLKLQKQSGESAVLCAFAGHATVIDGEAYQFLSRDYPGALVDNLERETGSFALFMAGAVGSTGPVIEGNDYFLKTRQYADSLTTRILPALKTIALTTDSTLMTQDLPLVMHEPALRISDDWQLRPWLFRSLLGDYPAEIKALRVGQTVFLGTPCDFSGMLLPDLLPTARQKKLNLIVTSFDGGYVGYITPDKYYHLARYETRDMNWFGPNNGSYFVEMMRGMMVNVE